MKKRVIKKTSLPLRSGRAGDGVAAEIMKRFADVGDKDIVAEREGLSSGSPKLEMVLMWSHEEEDLCSAKDEGWCS